MLKKMMSFALVCIMLVSASTSVFAADIRDLNRDKPILSLNAELDELDVVLAAGMYLGSVGIKADTSSVKVTPLYDLDKTTITAYYVSFSSSE